MLGQLPAGRLLLTTRRDVDWQRLAVHSGAWSSVLPAMAPTMTTDPPSSTSIWRGSLVAATATPLSQQRRIHRALAAAGDAGQHPDRVAWPLRMAACCRL